MHYKGLPYKAFVHDCLSCSHFFLGTVMIFIFISMFISIDVHGTFHTCYYVHVHDHCFIYSEAHIMYENLIDMNN